MLRIQQVTTGGADRTLRLEGSVAGPWVDELRRACDRALDGNDTATLTLELEAVWYVDRDGISLLKNLASRSVRLSNPSQFLAGLLEMEDR
jgi:hypothetical protein